MASISSAMRAYCEMEAGFGGRASKRKGRARAAPGRAQAAAGFGPRPARALCVRTRAPLPTPARLCVLPVQLEPLVKAHVHEGVAPVLGHVRVVAAARVRRALGGAAPAWGVHHGGGGVGAALTWAPAAREGAVSARTAAPAATLVTSVTRATRAARAAHHSSASPRKMSSSASAGSSHGSAAMAMGRLAARRGTRAVESASTCE